MFDFRARIQAQGVNGSNASVNPDVQDTLQMPSRLPVTTAKNYLCGVLS